MLLFYRICIQCSQKKNIYKIGDRVKKILYIATTADNRNRLDGETIKCRLLRDYLNEIKGIQVISIDTDNWKKHILKLVILIIKNYFKADTIIVSSADRGAHIVLDFFNKVKSKKDIYYFVIGGFLYNNIKKKKWNLKIYQELKQIYVEADVLKTDLNNININRGGKKAKTKTEAKAETYPAHARAIGGKNAPDYPQGFSQSGGFVDLDNEPAYSGGGLVPIPWDEGASL